MPTQGLDALDMAIAELEHTFGQGILQVGQTTFVKVDAISTSILSVDVALGCGGLPRGRIIEIFGGESCGKTTFTLNCIAACQQNGGRAAFIDAEHALDPAWAQKLGVDMSKLIVSQPDNGEQAMVIVEALVKHGAVDLIVVDSVAALVPTVELEGDISDANIGAQARLMSKGLRKLVGRACKGNTVVMFINQLRDKIGGFGGYGPSELTPGGRALKFYSSLRIELKRKETLKVGDHSIGMMSGVKIVKNKVAPPFKTTSFRICFGSEHQKPKPICGIDKVSSLLEAAVQLKTIETRGSNYYYDGQRLGAGKDAALLCLMECPEIASKLYNESLDIIRSNVKMNGVVVNDDVDGLVELEEDDIADERLIDELVNAESDGNE